MQARLEIQRFSVVRILVAFGVAAALLIGLQLGYALKATTVISGPSRVVVVSAQPSAQDDNRCVFINRVIGFGYVDPGHAAAPPSVARRRLPLDTLVHWETW